MPISYKSPIPAPITNIAVKILKVISTKFATTSNMTLIIRIGVLFSFKIVIIVLIFTKRKIIIPSETIRSRTIIMTSYQIEGKVTNSNAKGITKEIKEIINRIMTVLNVSLFSDIDP